VAYALDMGGFLLALHGFGATPLPANVFGKLVAGAFAFFAHRSFTFRVAGQSSPGSQALLYVAVLALNIPLSSAVLAGMLQVVPQPVPAKFVSDVICVVITYWLSKRYVFRRGAAPEAGGEGAKAP
jgi:putative flippase GtrA